MITTSSGHARILTLHLHVLSLFLKDIYFEVTFFDVQEILLDSVFQDLVNASTFSYSFLIFVPAPISTQSSLNTNESLS